MGISQLLLVTSVSAADLHADFTLVVKQCCLGSLINLFTAAEWRDELRLAAVTPVLTPK